MWVVSKNESNCLSENKMVSTLNWRHVSLLYVESGKKGGGGGAGLDHVSRKIKRSLQNSRKTKT